MQKTRKIEFWVGAFVLSAIAALLVLVFKVADVTSIGNGETYRLYASSTTLAGSK